MKNIKRIFTVILILIFAVILYSNAFIARAYSTISTSAYGMVVMEVNSGRLLYENNSQKRLPMASTTKILTAITVIENCNLSDIVTVNPRAVGAEGSSIYLQTGQKMSVEDLLYGLMLQSGNDAALALAYHTSKSVENFALLMNFTAQKIGAKNSNFVNPHGLHDPKHYTTAEDLAMISCYAMRNEDFHRIVGTKQHTLKSDDTSRVIANKNKILSMYEGGNGVKTGFTKKAGRCLVSSACRNGMEVVCAVLNCGDMWNECIAKMDLAFREYSMREIMPVYAARIATPGAKEPFVRAETLNGFSYPMKTGEQDGITVKIKLPQILSAPLAAGSEVGGIEIYLKERLLNSQKIYIINDIEPLTLLDYLNRILKEW